MKTRALRLFAIGCILLSSGCRDSAVTEPEIENRRQQLETGSVVAAFDCTIDAEQQTVPCNPSAPAASAQGPRKLMSMTNEFKLVLTNTNYDTITEVYSADVTLQNLWTVPIGTADGSTLAFTKVFFHEQGVVSYRAPGDTGTVSVRNPDGFCNCSAANQPYHSYPQILQPTEVSAPKRWEWNLPRTVLRTTFRIMVFTRFPGEEDIAAFPPDTVPSSIYDPSKVVYGDSFDSGIFLRDIVLLGFRPTATAEDRLAAVNRANGRVVGGIRVGPIGYYFIQVPDDGTTLHLRKALENLRRLPQVAWAGPEYLIPADAPSGASVRPNDSAWFGEAEDWTLSKDTIPDSPNWGMIAIDAPRAWGCTVGDSSVAIAVVDRRFANEADIENVTNGGWEGGHYPYPHGANVAAVLGAHGDNDIGIAGVIWKANFRYYNEEKAYFNLLVPYSGHLQAFGEALVGGSRVINISSQATFVEAVNGGGFRHRRPDPNNQADWVHAQTLGHVLGGLLAVGLPFAEDPLVVISAGNYEVDAQYSGYPVASFLNPDNVIVVGGIQRMAPGSGDFGSAFTRGTGWGDEALTPDIGSNWGELVDVYAPGTAVGTLWPGTLPARATGTSFAAPIVAGIAGLLLSADPSLSAKEMKDLIIEGGSRGNRYIINNPEDPADVRPVANAYESLRAAAERSGAGLCGNPVWQDSSGVVYARRGQGWGGPSEALFSAAAPLSGSDMSVQHSTRMVRFNNGTAFAFRNRQWIQTTPTAPANNASNLSRQGKSHDGDTIFTFTREAGPNPRYDEVFVIKKNGAEIARVTGPQVNKSNDVDRCVKWMPSGTEWSACVESFPTYFARSNTTASLAYAEARRELILSIVRDSVTQSIEEGAYFHGGYMQRNHFRDDYFSRDTHLYFIPLDNVTAARVVHVPAVAVNNATISEDGQHMVTRRATGSIHFAYTALGITSSSATTCYGTYQRIYQDRLETAFTLPNWKRYTCYRDVSFAP